MKAFGWPLTLSLLVASGASANAWGGNSMWAMGIGAASCAQFTGDYAKNHAIEAQYFAWAQGYMSGLNTELVMGNKPIRDLSAIAPDHQQLLIRTYCSAHPLDKYMEAVATMYGGLPTTPISQ
jgi:hypothetical protein